MHNLSNHHHISHNNNNSSRSTGWQPGSWRERQTDLWLMDSPDLGGGSGGPPRKMLQPMSTGLTRHYHPNKTRHKDESIRLLYLTSSAAQKNAAAAGRVHPPPRDGIGSGAHDPVDRAANEEWNRGHVYRNNLHSGDSATRFERLSGVIDGDLYIGALFSIHDQPSGSFIQEGASVNCGNIREQYGIQRAEVALKTIDEINRNKNLLPNITLGISIRDSCWYAPVALKQSLKFIPGLDPKNKRTTVGVIGPGSSAITIQVQNLLQLFNIPQVGYSATSKDLSDKSRFGYFFRVVPSDYYQAQVLVDLIKQKDWNYVSVVNTEGNYGASGMKAFLIMSEKEGICTAAELTVHQHADINTDPIFNETLKELYEHKKARAVVCFCEGRTIRGLLNAIKQNNLEGYFHIIGSDGWADRTDVIRGFEETAIGGTSIKIHTSKVPDFESHYFGLQPVNTARNPWVEEFWRWRFNCTFLKTDNSSSFINTNDVNYNPGDGYCSGDENLNIGYKQDTKLALVVKAIYTLAYGLDLMQRDLCGQTSLGFCSNMRPFDGKLYKRYIQRVQFRYEDEIVQFDDNGDPPGRYDIMNFQKSGNKTDYVTIGSWYNGTLKLNRPEQMHPKAAQYGPQFESVCSKPCGLGEFKHFQEGKECCWSCVKCREEEYLYNETTCRPCLRGWWPDAKKTDCERIPVESLEWYHLESILVIILASIGLVLTAITSGIFIWYNNTPIVKSSSRELSYLILAGCSLSFLTTFPLVQRPSHFSCVLARILPGTSIACIYGALTTKTNRIARILAGRKMITSRLKFMSSGAQVFIASSLVFVEMVAVLVSMLVVPPVPMVYYPSLTRVNLVCHNNWKGMIIPFAFDFVLLFICTCYAVRTRNVPENFNEAKFIGFSCYTTCVIWVSYIPIWFGSDIKVIATCVCLSLSAYVTLALQFLPKLYLIIFQPHKNHRSHFTTSKDIRCHIGKGAFALVATLGEGHNSNINAISKVNGILEPSATCQSSYKSKDSKQSISSRATVKSGSCVTRDRHAQTDEFHAFCFQCDNKVKVYPEPSSDLISRLKDKNGMRNGVDGRLSIMEENSFSGNHDIKNIFIHIRD